MLRESYDDLKYQNDQLKAEIAQLTKDPAMALRMRMALGLTPQEADFLILFYKRAFVSNDQIHDHLLDRGDADGPADSLIKVVICKIRKKLKSSGVPGTIQNLYGSGYKMSDDLRNWIRDYRFQ